MEKLLFKLEVFEGPLDLLMHLIQKNKVNIYDIPISEITEQYMEYLALMEEMDLDVSSEFLVMAANLLYIKSRMLLPKYSDSEDTDDEDPRQELVDRLLEYQKYKEISQFLSEREGRSQYIFFKEPELLDIEGWEQENLVNLSIDELIKAFYRIVMKNRRKAPPSKKSFKDIVGVEKVSVQSKAKEIIAILKNRSKVLFLELFKNMHSRAEVVAAFLAVLELIKLNRIIVEQRQYSKEIYVSLKGNGEVDGD